MTQTSVILWGIKADGGIHPWTDKLTLQTQFKKFGFL